MYAWVLTVHSWVRWLILLAWLVVMVRSLTAWRQARPWSAQDRRWLSVLLGLADVQLLLGLALLIVLSPTTRRFFQEGAQALADTHVSYWFMEHAVPMIVAVFLMHVGHVFVRRGRSDRSRHLRTLLLFGLAGLIVLASTPWPFSPVGRPWFRLGLS